MMDEFGTMICLYNWRGDGTCRALWSCFCQVTDGGGQVQLVINTPRGLHAHADGAEIRAAAIAMGIPLLTTLSAAMAAVAAIRALSQNELRYKSLQDHFAAKSSERS